MQIVIIHGGDTFASHEAFIASLKTKEVHIERMRRKKDWKTGLREGLGKEHDILEPRMPSPDHAHFEEWKLWFERIIPLLAGEVSLIGHSLGGIFLMKYLSENAFPKKIRSLIIIAAPFWGEREEGRERGGFVLGDNLALVERQVSSIIFFHSTDDEVVPFTDLEKYRLAFPHARAIPLENRGHVTGETFPELMALLRAEEA